MLPCRVRLNRCLTSPCFLATILASDPFIQFDDVHFRYGNRPILDGVSLSIPQGKLVAIMGGSGSGKTTLLRLIAGQLHAAR